MENLVILTPQAVERYHKMMAEKGQAGFGLRIRVVAGGCSGMEYEMGFEETPKDDDLVFESNGQKVFVDPKSVPHLKGLQIDYRKGLVDAGFKITNPNAKAHCGCGESFN